MSDIEQTPVNHGASAELASAIAMTAEIVSAYVSRNSLPAAELPTFIASIYAGLGVVGQPAAPVEEVRREPAVPIKKSVTPEHIICLEDGKKFKTLKRHLATTYNMTPDDYRTKWGLPKGYPMTAPSYSEKRSSLAKVAGLGVSRGAAVAKKASKPYVKKAA